MFKREFTVIKIAKVNDSVFAKYEIINLKQTKRQLKKTIENIIKNATEYEFVNNERLVVWC